MRNCNGELTMARFKISISCERDAPLPIPSDMFVEESICLHIMQDLLRYDFENIHVEVTDTESGGTSSKSMRVPKT